MEDHFGKAEVLARAGKDPRGELREFHKTELLHLKEMGADKVEVATAGPGNSCQECMKLDGKVFTIEAALKTMPLPVKTCACDVFGSGRGFCRCTYVAAI